MTLPSFDGFSPRLDAADRLLDRAHQRRIERLRDDQASARESTALATWLSGIFEP